MGASQSSLDQKERKKHLKKLEKKKSSLLESPRRADNFVKRKSFDFSKGRLEEADGPLITISDYSKHGQPLVVTDLSDMGILELESLFASPYIQWFRHLWQSLAVSTASGKSVLPFNQLKKWTRLPQSSARLLFDTICRIDAVLYPTKDFQSVDGTLTYTKFLQSLAILCSRPSDFTGPVYLVPTVPNYIDSLSLVLKCFCFPKEITKSEVTDELGFLAELDPTLVQDHARQNLTKWVISGKQLKQWINLAGMVCLTGLDAWKGHDPNDETANFELPEPESVVHPIYAAGLVEQCYRYATQPSNLYSPRVPQDTLDWFEFTHDQLTRWVRINAPTMFGSIGAFLTRCFLIPLVTVIPESVIQDVLGQSRQRTLSHDPSDHSDAASVHSTERKLSARASTISLAPTTTNDLSKLTLLDLVGLYTIPAVLRDSCGTDPNTSKDHFQNVGDSKILNRYMAWLLLGALPQPLPPVWRILYRSSEHGCSMNRFQYHVFKYNGPTLLLLVAKPTRIEPVSMTAYLADIDPVIATEKGLQLSNLDGGRVGVGSVSEFASADTARAGFLEKAKSYEVQPLVFGMYVSTSWRASRHFWGDSNCSLFQLNPATHVGVFPSIAGWKKKIDRAFEQKAAVIDAFAGHGTEAATKAVDSASHAAQKLNDMLPMLLDHLPGQSFCFYQSGMSTAGSKASRGPAHSSAPLLSRPSSATGSNVGECTGIGFGGRIGDFRLYVDSLLQQGYFQQSWGDTGNETFVTNSFVGKVKVEFEVVDLEVIGLGGDAVYEQQEAEWHFEEKAAAKRQGVNVKSLLDQDVDSALLEMAGVHKSYVKDMGLEKNPNWENDLQTHQIESTQRISSQPLANTHAK